MSEPHQTQGGVRVPESLGAAISLVIQILVAVVLFLVVGAGAVVLNLATQFCQERRLAPQWVIQGMSALEMFLWAADALCFVLLVAYEVRSFFMKLWMGRKG